MSVKSNYFKMNKEEFENYINNLKHSSSSIHLLNNKYFYYLSTQTNNLIISLNKKIIELDSLINSFTPFSKRQIVQSFLIEEIEATNKIENINSTWHDIFKIINQASCSKDKKIISISNAYKQLLEFGGIRITSNKDIRNVYDKILYGAINKNNLPDGAFYRKNPVYITDGLSLVHTGTVGEDNIIKLMEEFINLYNSNTEVLTKMILCHFMIETIHPFYDGNGRLGRFLISNGIFLETKSYSSFIISLALEHEKDKYYKAFKQASDKYEFGSLNTFLNTILLILQNEFSIIIKKLLYSKDELGNYSLNFKMTKSDNKIYSLLYEASVFSNYGVSSEEIIKETGVSKRTLIYSLNKLRDNSLLIETKIGKFSYYKLSNNL